MTRRRALTLAAATVLCAGAWTGHAGATPPGTNGLIAVHTIRGEHVQAWMVRPDGSGVTRFPVHGEVDFSPDGQRVVVAEGKALRITDRNGANPILVHRDPRGVGRPAWSPRGDLLVFDRYEDGPFSIPVAGGTPTRIDRRGSDADVSPSGSVAYQVAAAEGTRVVVAGGDGSGRRELGRGSAPSWSPDGTRVAFARGRRIVVAAPDGAVLQQAVIVTGRDAVALAGVDDLALGLSWTPDGTEIAFVRRDPSREHDTLAVLDLATGAVRELLSDRGVDASLLFEPRWQALPAGTDIILPVAPPPSGPCYLLGSDTIRQTARARLLTENGIDYGCLFAADRLFRLYRPPRWMVDSELGATALAGRYAAYEMELYHDGQSLQASKVFVRDLRSGRLLSERYAARFGPPVDGFDVVRIVVDARGSIAWTVRGLQEAGPERQKQVLMLARRRIRVLDTGARLRLNSLERRGNRLIWRSGGRVRHATLR